MSTTVTLPGNIKLDGPRGRTYASILETVGSTPLVAAPKFAESEGIKANLLFKCEFFNPLASVKDRIALNMIEQAERRVRLEDVVAAQHRRVVGIELAQQPAPLQLGGAVPLPGRAGVHLPLPLRSTVFQKFLNESAVLFGRMQSRSTCIQNCAART